MGSRGADLFGRKGTKCFIKRTGPRVFTLSVSRRLGSVIWEMDFSGGVRRMPGRVRARWRWWVVGGNSSLAFSAADWMADSSFTSRFTTWRRSDSG